MPENSIALRNGPGTAISASAANTFTSASDGNVWRHVVVTYNAAAATPTHIYKDGADLAMYGQSFTGTVAPFDQVWIGAMDNQLYLTHSLTKWRSTTGRSRPRRSRPSTPARPPTACRSGRPTWNRSSIAVAFSGPTGTNSYYLPGDENFIAGSSFQEWHQYLQYRLEVKGRADAAATPFIDAVRVTGDKVEFYDNTEGDFLLGKPTNTDTTPRESDTTPYSADIDTPYLTLKRLPNGGFPTNGVYTSRPLDARTSNNVFWVSLWWSTFTELSALDPSVIKVWRADPGSLGTGTQHVGRLHRPGEAGPELRDFNGLDRRVDVGDLGADAVKTTEFWIKPKSANNGILELNTGVSVGLSNGLVNVVGFPAAGTRVLVNGVGTTRRLRAGWNHVAVVSDTGVLAANVRIGRVGGSYLDGWLDDVAFHKTALSPSAVKAHFSAGGRDTGGRVRFRAKAGPSPDALDALPFIGPGGTEVGDDYYVAGGGQSLPFNPAGNQYFQYRAFLLSDGESAPGIPSITVTNRGQISNTFIDDTGGELGREPSATARCSGTIPSGTAMKLLCWTDPWPRDLSTSPRGLPPACGTWTTARGAAPAPFATPRSPRRTVRRRTAPTRPRMRMWGRRRDTSTPHLRSTPLLSGPSLAANFTVSFWFKSSTSTRCAPRPLVRSAGFV